MTMSVFVGPKAVNKFAPKRVAVKRRKGFSWITLSGLARNFGDVFELWSGGQCGVGVVVSGDALE